jgi:hypothetical protein
MSGGLSVPFTFWGAFGPGNQKAILFILAGVCVLVTAYLVWAQERRKVIDLEVQLDLKKNRREAADALAVLLEAGWRSGEGVQNWLTTGNGG